MVIENNRSTETNMGTKWNFWGTSLLSILAVGISIFIYQASICDKWFFLATFVLFIIFSLTRVEVENTNLNNILTNLYIVLFSLFLAYQGFTKNTEIYTAHCWIGILFGIVFPLASWWEYNEDLSKHEKEKFISGNELNIDRTINIDKTKDILVDIKKQKIIFWDNQTCFQNLNYKIFDFKDIYDFDLIEDGFSKLQGRGMVSAVGAITFGVTGAVIGAVAGDRKSKNYSTSIYVNIEVNDLNAPLVSIVFLNKEVEKSSYEYKQTLKKAQEFIAILTYVKNHAKNNQDIMKNEV